jgi:hypothetical protein
MQPLDPQAFERLHGLVLELLHVYKGNDSVSKALLHELYTVPRVVIAEAEHRPVERPRLEHMARTLEYCFGLLLLDEVPEDRVPGVPRIV